MRLHDYYGITDVILSKRKKLARGASSVVYLAVRKEAERAVECVVKELYPQKFEEQGRLKRYLSGAVRRIKYPNNSEWKDSEERFILAAERQMLFLEQNPEHTASVKLHGLYRGNGTLYTVSSDYCGISWNHIRDESVFETLLYGSALAKAVGEWHKDSHGYLLVDIKDANVIIPAEENLRNPGDAYRVFLCDFDSVVTFDTLSSCHLYFSSETAAPELASQNRALICQATDVYAIAATIFKRLTGCSPTNTPSICDCRRKIYLRGTEREKIASFFSDALSSNVNKRIQNCEVLECRLQELADMVDKYNKHEGVL